MRAKGYFTSNLVCRSRDRRLGKEWAVRIERPTTLLGPHGELAGARRGRRSGEWIST
jgi:hypothetical protein